VMVVGSDLDGMSTQNWRMPAPPRLAVIDVDPERATRHYRANVTVAADAAAGLAAVANALSGPARAPWAGLAGRRHAAHARLAAEAPEAWTLLETVAAATGPGTPIFADMAIPGYWVAGFHPFARPRRLGYPVGWGTLGFAFPASLGAAAAGEGPVLCVCGDGGFLFAVGELATAAQEGLDVCVLVVDDGGYGMLRYDQERAGAPAFGVDLATPDWTALGAAFGIAAEAAPDLGPGLAAALGRGLDGGGPRLVSARAALPPPPTTSPRWYRPASAAG
jgi:thiamine pyrophosphate-dependent acetolactate synthase large subunit-like protein